MPRFPVSFGKRRSTADSLENGAVAAEPSFRVLERPDVPNAKNFDAGVRNSVYKPSHNPKASISVDLAPMDDNMFADLKSTNRSGSGLSNNTTKSSLTDNSSRHSNASTAPSSTHENSAAIHEDSKRPVPKKSYQDIPLPPIPKSASSGFLKAAGRTFSFGTKKSHSSGSAGQESDMQSSVDQHGPEQLSTVGRPRTTTSSTTSTATPPKLDESSSFDLGGDFSKMLSFEKRKSTLTLKDDQNGRQALGPRSLTGNRLNQPQPSPLTIDKTSRIEPSPFSWGSHHSGDGLLNSPSLGNENAPPVPKHVSAYSPRPQGPSQSSSDGSLQAGHHGNDRRFSGEGEGEDTLLLKDISTATRFLKSGGAQTGNGRYRRDEDTLGSGYKQVSSPKDEEDLFDTSLVNSSRAASRYVAEKPSPPRNKVMTPAEFERYRQDKERGSDSGDKSPTKGDDDDDEDINYEDDEDDMEKSKQAAKQRQKQEAHMTVYRQQMMKVTGEPATSGHRPGFSASSSTPNLLQARGPSPNKSVDASGESDDEEVPLAILAAHGFPNKNRPPHRLSSMMSNPNLKVAAQTSYARPGSAHGDSPASSGPSPSGGRLPAFARGLPQDPFVGAGLVNHPVRESLSFGGGAPAALQTPGVPPGGLVGVIAGEERARALRRGSPAIDTHKPLMPMSGPLAGPGGFDPLGAVPSHMMYPASNPRPLSTVDQTQAQMNQMQQFMQMQMQFMQMQMMQTNGNRMSQIPQMAPQMPGMPGGQMLGNGMMGSTGDMRHSFVDNGSVFDLPIRPEQHGRSMSMVQPSSASWIQPPMQGPGYAPSIRIQGAGYAPSIAPSERSNIGLPGRYRPVSQMPAAAPADPRKSTTISGGLGWDQPRTKSPLGFGTAKTPSLGPDATHSKKTVTTVAADDDEDDEQAWAAMKQKREKKRSLWKSKKSFGSDISLMIK
ncbi:hypothetical protein MGG_04625 [Pyricularia oryzae 70-15]|uniref:Uncharacterized protein n=1 Tax=Pyricularia oryzae (strain 70-15 / ATCC MYA-4617 / FGSC 8958) TaxID=242507 RepID=G4MRQ1_PYRO7|nr:uncharacterized protein MGG_04625 [Pyricularia oryzae 70-15]EHA58266.1 hypothetical protein MGG_04625 [Pyricularia oryzae 70-15]